MFAGSIPIAVGIVGVLGSFLLASLAFAVVFQKKKFPFDNPLFNLAAALPLGPIALAWLLWIYFRFLPHQSYALYVALCLLPFIGVLAFHLKEMARILTALANALSQVNLRPWRRSKGAYDWPVGLVWLGGCIILIATAVQLFGMPLMASDPLEYASLSEVIYLDKSLESYPLAPSTEQGFYARSSHPPAFHMMIVYSYIWQGGGDSSRLLRLIEFHYLFAFVALLALTTYKAMSPGRSRNMAVALSLLFTMSIPFYVSLVTAFHIDPIRIPLFLNGMVFVAALLERESVWEKESKRKKGLMLKDGKLFTAPIVLTGVAVGFGMFAHSIGILLLPFTQGAYFLVTRSSFWRRCAICTVFGLTALFIGAGQYVQNTIDFGVPFHDSEPVWELPQVDHKTDVRYRRDLVDLRQRIHNGILAWVYKNGVFGGIHNLAVLSVLLFWRPIWANRYARVMVLGVMQFYAIAAVTMSLGVDIMIKNIRYMLTLMPFLVVLASIGGGRFYAYITKFTQTRSE